MYFELCLLSDKMVSRCLCAVLHIKLPSPSSRLQFGKTTRLERGRGVVWGRYLQLLRARLRISMEREEKKKSPSACIIIPWHSLAKTFITQGEKSGKRLNNFQVMKFKFQRIFVSCPFSC